MDLRVLNNFLAVAREESFSRAAAAIHISQPTLSRQIAELEEELGRKLFVRGARKLTLTAEGQLLKKKSRRTAGACRKDRNGDPRQQPGNRGRYLYRSR